MEVIDPSQGTREGNYCKEYYRIARYYNGCELIMLPIRAYAYLGMYIR